MTPALVAIDQRLRRYERFGIDLGLTSTEKLLQVLGNPQSGMPVVHVAGTNGKGSVCAYVASILKAAGYRVGRYTSPHLMDWTERIWIDGASIDGERLDGVLQAIEQTIAAAALSPTQFEVITAAAWCCFAQAQVDVVVLEVGLGGRLDATNVCSPPLVSVITSIGLDHCDFLGSTLAKIAYEKAGILKRGCPAVVGPLPLEAAQVVQSQLQALGCPAVWPSPARWVERPKSEIAMAYPLACAQGVTYPLPLAGEVQLVNSAIAIATLQQLRLQGWEISDTAIINGMETTRWPGRLQWVDWQGQQLLLDGAHNPAAATALRQYVDQLNPPATQWLLGMLNTKEHHEILAALLRPGDHLSLVPITDAHCADPQALQTLAQAICPQLSSCRVYPTLAAGLAALEPSAQPVLAGSLYLVGEFLRDQARPCA